MSEVPGRGLDKASAAATLMLVTSADSQDPTYRLFSESSGPAESACLIQDSILETRASVASGLYHL